MTTGMATRAPKTATRVRVLMGSGRRLSQNLTIPMQMSAGIAPVRGSKKFI
jgi:hypothetical protein